MKTNPAGVALIKRFEGLRLTPYRCPAGVLTVGYGHTGEDVQDGESITEDEADRLLEKDLERFEVGISHSLGGAATTDNQFAAMVSLAFNIGLGAFKTSSVLRFHRDGKPQSAAQSFILWNKVDHKTVAGLTRRRQAELALYLS